MLPGCGYELVCPPFDGAIVRPMSPDACIDSVKVAISESYGVEIRSREISAPLALGLRHAAITETLPGRETGVVPDTTSGPHYMAAAVGPSRSSDEYTANIATRDSFPTEPGEAALERTASSGQKNVAESMRRDAIGPEQVGGADIVTTYKGSV